LSSIFLNVSLVETKITVWPKTAKEIGTLIKRAESLLDDLKIDLDAADSKPIPLWIVSPQLSLDSQLQ
jgi:hypothetical protein